MQVNAGKLKVQFPEFGSRFISQHINLDRERGFGKDARHRTFDLEAGKGAGFQVFTYGKNVCGHSANPAIST